MISLNFKILADFLDRPVVICLIFHQNSGSICYDTLCLKNVFTFRRLHRFQSIIWNDPRCLYAVILVSSAVLWVSLLFRNRWF